MFVTVLTSCSSCGAQGVLVTEEYPTAKQLNDTIIKVGGMFCIQQAIYEVKIGESSCDTFGI